jgi:hypothetical protein
MDKESRAVTALKNNCHPGDGTAVATVFLISVLLEKLFVFIRTNR